MSARFEELDDDFPMSRLFTAAEVKVARLALTRLSGTDLDVVVRGQGLGFTALTVLADPRVQSMAVVKAFGIVGGSGMTQIASWSSSNAVAGRCTGAVSTPGS